ncbi:MAG: phosphoserine phosphatase SerB [Pseudomonadota bacterium]
MYTVTLLTNPANPALDRALVDSLRNAWGGGDTQWLSPDEAAEFSVEVVPGNQWDVWTDLQGMGVDMAVQPSARRKKQLLLADMDSTIINQECIDELATEAGVGARVAEITARAMNGELDFEGALTERVGMLKGLKTTVIDTVLANRITLASGAETLLRTLKANGVYTALVSGGFTAFTSRIAERLGFDENRANMLEAAEGHLTGHVIPPILGRAAKVTALEELTAKLGITEADVMAVGDGANDLGMLTRAGAGVALHAKPVVAAEVDLRINHGDLTALLYLQGYSRDAFV